MSTETAKPDAVILYSPNDPLGVKVTALMDSVEKKRGSLVTALPKFIEYDFWIKSVQMAFVENPDLFQCSPQSIMKAVMNSAYVGLAPNKQLGLAAFVKWGAECVYMPMVQGLVKVTLMHPAIRDVQTAAVYADDEFYYQRGTDPKIEHVPARRRDREAELVAAYSVAWMTNGSMSFEVLEAADIAAVRSVAKTDNVWRAWRGEMSRKAAFRRHRKWLPTSSELLRAIEVDDQMNDVERVTTLSSKPVSGGMGALRDRIAPNAIVDTVVADEGDGRTADASDVTTTYAEPGSAG